KGRLAKPFDVSRDQTMGGEIDHLVVGKRQPLHISLARCCAQVDVGRRRAKLLGDGTQFVGGLLESWQRPRKCFAINLNPLPKIRIAADSSNGNSPDGRCISWHRWCSLGCRQRTGLWCRLAAWCARLWLGNDRRRCSLKNGVAKSYERLRRR